MSKYLSADEADERIKTGDISVIDVRTPKEYAEGHLPGAKNIDIAGADFSDKISRLNKDKDYLVYCLSGGRSRRAQNMMAEAGLRGVYNLTGGIVEWSNAGKPVSKN